METPAQRAPRATNSFQRRRKSLCVAGNAAFSRRENRGKHRRLVTPVACFLDRNRVLGTAKPSSTIRESLVARKLSPRVIRPTRSPSSGGVRLFFFSFLARGPREPSRPENYNFEENLGENSPATPDQRTDDLEVGRFVGISARSFSVSGFSSRAILEPREALGCTRITDAFLRNIKIELSRTACSGRSYGNLKRIDRDE